MFLKFYSGDICTPILNAIVKNCTDNLDKIQAVEAGFHSWEDADATRLGLDPALAKAATDRKFVAPEAHDNHFASLQKTAANLYLLQVMIKVLGEQAEKAVADKNVAMGTMVQGLLEPIAQIHEQITDLHAQADTLKTDLQPLVAGGCTII